MKTDRTTVKRFPEMGSHDREVINAILDEALVCHVGFLDGSGQPVVTPSIHARIGDAPISMVQRRRACSGL